MEFDIKNIICLYFRIKPEKWDENKECLINSVKLGAFFGGILGICLVYKMVGGLFIPGFSVDQKRIWAWEAFQQVRDFTNERWSRSYFREIYWDRNYFILVREIKSDKMETDDVLEGYFNQMKSKKDYRKLNMELENKLVSGDYHGSVHVSIHEDRDNPNVFTVRIETW